SPRARAGPSASRPSTAHRQLRGRDSFVSLRTPISHCIQPNTHYLNTETVFLYVFFTAQANVVKNRAVLGLCDNPRHVRTDAAACARPSDHPTQDYHPSPTRQDVV